MWITWSLRERRRRSDASEICVYLYHVLRVVPDPCAAADAHPEGDQESDDPLVPLLCAVRDPGGHDLPGDHGRDRAADGGPRLAPARHDHRLVRWRTLPDRDRVQRDGIRTRDDTVTEDARGRPLKAIRREREESKSYPLVNRPPIVRPKN